LYAADGQQVPFLSGALVNGKWMRSAFCDWQMVAILHCAHPLPAFLLPDI
jgi:hypothetical protein